MISYSWVTLLEYYIYCSTPCITYTCSIRSGCLECPLLVKKGAVCRISKSYTDLVDIAYIFQELEFTLPVLKPDKERLENPPENNMQVTWLGHACVLVQFDGISIVTDPMFSDRASPLQVGAEVAHDRPYITRYRTSRMISGDAYCSDHCLANE